MNVFPQLVVFVGVVCFCPPSCHGGKPPHIIFVVADDLGWNDVGWRNPDILTPNLDRYARKGVILNDSYVQPVCTPSRNCFMTGFYPFHTGMQHFVILASLPKFVPAKFTFLPQLLKKVGYKTHAIGKWHLGSCNWKYTPTYRGFDTFFGFHNGNQDYYSRMRADDGFNGFDFRLNTSVFHAGDYVYSPTLYGARAEQIIRSHDKDTPLYLYLPFQSVHEPLEVPKRFEDMYAHIQTKDRRVYCGMVSALDEAFGRIAQALEDTGIDDNMLLVFTTDNGGPTYRGANNWPLRGAKATTWQGGTRGSAFVYSKTLLSKTAYINNEMIHAVDWFPTLLELAGLQPEPGIDGVSQLQTIINGAPSNRTEFVYNIDDVTNSSAIRYGDYKLIQGGAGSYNGWYPPPKSGENYSKIVNEDETKAPAYMLFNVKEDPTEHHDLSQTQPEVLQRLKQRLQEWMTSLVPAQNPKPDPKSNPKYYGGNWSPGWC
ncbi:arylsulfatase B-like [Littorina saxatilis]|uniref:Sulfatase N-terminal domain-containing protein n=1 Tax=Littorina saxatilis TaxID=31220 RepID=A0AAN9B5D0_9CAEN